VTARLTTGIEKFPTAGAWCISRGSVTEIEVVTAQLALDGKFGRAECRPYPRYNETPVGVVAEIEAVAPLLLPLLRKDPHAVDLCALMPAGAARNAVDCAIWDLRAKLSGRRAWDLAGLAKPVPRMTAFSLSLDTPARMQAAAALNATRPLLKVKLGGNGDLERIRAVRAGAPKSRIIVDANEGWTPQIYRDLAPVLLSLGVTMIEQPLPAGDDAALADMDRVLPVCADEACRDRTSLAQLVGKYDIINIKLDKTGGLTEALLMHAQARAMGFQVMIGCMLGTSLAMAPATLLGAGADLIDLDGPLLLALDREHALRYDGQGIHPPAAALWG
jgi:L-Ala-D/L-Glu epimerase / N-acetyl-D-glutamate racemase